MAILFLATCAPATNATAAVVNLLVGTAGGAVQSYNAQTGSNEGTFVSGLGNVIGVTTLGDHVYVGSYAESRVYRYSYPTAGTGTVVADTSSGMGQPAGLTTGADGKVYIASFSNNQIMTYDPVANTTSTFVTAGQGGLARPHGLAFGPDGGLYVGSFDGNVYRYTGGGASDPSALYSGAVYANVNTGAADSGPRGLTFGPDRSGDGSRDLYVTDQQNKQIRVYAGPLETGGLQPGAFIETYIGYLAAEPGALTDPVGVEFVGSKFYVSDFVQQKIKVYDGATGTFETDLVAAVGASPNYFAVTVPEPGTVAQAILGLAGLLGFRACRSRGVAVR